MSKYPIHLFWLGSPTEQVLASKARWEKLHPDRQVNLWHDDTILLPRLYHQWIAHFKIPPHLSDLIRWSALLRFGGWYFDVDVSPRVDLDSIEYLEALPSGKLWLTYRWHVQGTLAGDMLFMPKDWAPAYWKLVIDWLATCTDNAYTCFEWMLLRELRRQYPESIQVGHQDRYGLGGKLLSRKHDRLDQIKQKKSTPSKYACPHRGFQIDTVDCKTGCRGVEMKVFACDLFGKCTIKESGHSRIKGCMKCEERPK